SGGRGAPCGGRRGRPHRRALGARGPPGVPRHNPAGSRGPASGGHRVRDAVDLLGFRRVDGAHRDPARPCPGRGAGVALAAADLAVIRAGSVLDLGTGCGIQLVHALDTADAATGTDITPRCLDLAAATLAVNGLDAELL